jgi:hypothetical protein
MQVCKYAGMQVCMEGRVSDLPESPVEGSKRSVSMLFPLYKYATMQVCSYTSMQVCMEGRFSDLPESPVEGRNRSVSMQFAAVQVSK